MLKLILRLKSKFVNWLKRHQVINSTWHFFLHHRFRLSSRSIDPFNVYFRPRQCCCVGRWSLHTSSLIKTRFFSQFQTDSVRALLLRLSQMDKIRFETFLRWFSPRNEQKIEKIFLFLSFRISTKTNRNLLEIRFLLIQQKAIFYVKILLQRSSPILKNREFRVHRQRLMMNTLIQNTKNSLVELFLIFSLIYEFFFRCLYRSVSAISEPLRRTLSISRRWMHLKFLNEIFISIEILKWVHVYRNPTKQLFLVPFLYILSMNLCKSVWNFRLRNHL